MDPILTQNIAAELGLEDMPVKERDSILLKIGQIIFQRIMMRALDEMNEEVKEKFDQALGESKGNPESILDFLRANIKNFDELAGEEIAGFKKESIDLLRAAKKG